MFASLRSRLWLSYAALIALMLAVIGVALFLALANNPRIYQSANARLETLSQELLPKVNLALAQKPERIQQAIEKESRQRQVRLAILNPDGTLLVESATLLQGSLPVLSPDRLPDAAQPVRSGIARDSRRVNWFYQLTLTQDGHFLFVGTQRPLLPLRELLRNEVAGPLLWSGLVALVVAFLLALGMSRWITAPMQRMVAASRELSEGKNVTLPVEGPLELQELALSLNEMNRKVQASQQSQHDFLANVSHELKTPLTSIQGFSQAILDGAVQTPEALQQAAHVIYDESNRMYRLVLDLLTLARLESGTANLQRAQVDLVALVANVAAKFTPQAQQAGVTLATHLTELPMIVGDGDRLAQVFTNLVDNALKFTPPGGHVFLNVRMQSGQALVEVVDSGRGVALEDRERIFERFYQTDKSRRRGGADHGVGLGLPIARQIVLAHAGKIWVDSPDGQGSHFYVLLPVVRPDDATLAVSRKGRG